MKTLRLLAAVLLSATTAWADAGAWQEEKSANAGLSAAARGYRIHSRLAPDGKTEFKVAVPAGASPQDGRTYAGVKSLRGVGHYLAVETGDYVQYYDLLDGVRYTSGGERREDFKLVATVIEGVLSSAHSPAHAGPSAMRDFDVLRDAMARYLGGSAAAAETSAARILARTEGGPYHIVLASAERVVIDDRRDYYSVWPVVEELERPLLKPQEQDEEGGPY